jgi:soluble lytic murein transglycosylase
VKKKAVIAISVLLSFVLFGLVVYQLFFVKDYPLRYKEEILKYADAYSVPADLVCAVINTESGYDPNAMSYVGAVGLMQLLPSTAGEVARKLKIDDYDLYDPETNINFGTYYLAYLYGQFNDWETALAAYNAGIGNVKLWLKDQNYSADGKTLIKIPFRETSNFVKRVKTAREVYAVKLEDYLSNR